MIAVIPAAGIGQRMGSAIPKQYLQCAGASILDHAISALLAEPRIERVFVALQPDDRWFASSQYASHSQVVRVNGGATRAESVLNGVATALESYDKNILVAVHDAARPCLPLVLLATLLDTASRYPHLGAILALPARDTIKQADDQGAIPHIRTTLDRETIWLAQTPQVFRLGDLQHALQNAIAQGLVITDEASAIEADGGQPILVPSSRQVMKVTDPEDLPLAEFYLQKLNCDTSKE